MALNGLKSLINGLSALDLEREQLILIGQNKDRLVLAQAEVLEEGKDKTGLVRRDKYHPFTISEKERYGKGLGRVTDRVTFYMTGNLYASLRAKITSKTFIVESKEFTFEKMIKRIGKENYGIDQQRIDMFRNAYVITPLRKILFDRTGLGIK